MGWCCNGSTFKTAGGVTVPLATNPYIRYHREGGLELSMLADEGLLQETLAIYLEKH